MKTGGSNYVNINGDYGNPPIGTYHLFQEKVASDFVSMFEHGQRKITFVCFFAPLDFPAARETHRWGHIVSSMGGVLFEGHQQNLVSLLALVQQTGYNQINFRFAAAAEAADVHWDTWNSDQFRQNWAFIDSVRTLVLANTTLPVVFDLGLENGNSRLDINSTEYSNLHQLYCRRLWRLYTEAYGPDDSCGFSIIHAGDGLRAMLRTFEQVNLPRPGCYCLDAYNNAYTSLTDVASVLQEAGESLKTVYLQETNYNDAQTCADVKQAISETNMNFGGIFQWPKVRDHVHGFPDVYPRRFDNYLVEVE